MLRNPAVSVTSTATAALRRGLNGLAVAVALGTACTGDPTVDAGLGPAGPGTLALSVSGLPAGATAAISVASTQGFQHSSSATETLAAIPPGSYVVTAVEVVVAGDRYVPAPVTQTIVVPSGGAASAAVAYVLVTARMQLTLSGVPPGAELGLQLSGPGGYSNSLSAATVVAGLLPGSYTLQTPAFTLDGDQYRAQPESREVLLSSPDTIPVLVPVAYALASGRLTVEVSGVPPAGSGSVRVTGPGLDHLVTQTETLVGLTPGSYLLTASSIAAGGQTWAPSPVSFSVGVAASPTPTLAQVGYHLASGSLQVVVAGIPSGAGADLTVTGPAGFSLGLSGSQLLTGLVPGTYSVSAVPVSAGGQLYQPAPVVQSLVVTASPVPQVAGVSYSLATASLSLTISGLPSGTAASVLLGGPDGYSLSLTGSQVVSGLVAGQYSITSSSVASGGFNYAAQAAVQSVTLNGGATTAAAVHYVAITGALSLSVSGLPGGTAASVTLSGPGGFSQVLSGSQTLTGLLPGDYAVVSAAVSSGGTTYLATPASQSVPVAAGALTSASVGYAAAGPPPTLDLSINGAYLTQATQRYDGSVPLVAGRDAYLRVFAVANQANAAQPDVRVRLYSGATLVQTYVLHAPAGSVPTAADESLLSRSWNVLVSGALVQPGLKLLADVDPADAVAESVESNNQFPVSGTAAPVEVRALPTFTLRFVPVLQQANGLQGSVSGANQEAFLTDLKKMLPVGAYDADVRAPYTTTAPALQSGNGNLAWNTILSELLALRSADASTRYYYGVAKVSYGSGVAGIGYVGGSARTALGWDFLPSATNVMAHEVGHNMGRLHAPCGGPAGPDPSYPYPGAQIGVWGMDVSTLTLMSPTLPDLMSYCGPNWISDYNWTGMLSYRQGGPNNAPESGAGAGLLVWGRITPGGVVLEPAFQVPASARLAPSPGDNRLELLAADGAILGSVAFAATEVADLPGGAERHFAFVVPTDASRPAPAGLRVVTPSGTASRFAATAGTADPAPLLARVNPDQVELRWNAARFPMVLVRDAATGEVLSFARGGTVRLWSRATDFSLQFSDGIRGATRPVRVFR